MYQLNKQDGYIVSLTQGVRDGNMTEAEYDHMMAIFQSRPNAPRGYYCRLRDDLTWEMCEVPPSAEEDEPATIADYEAALAELGVEV